MGSKGLKNVIFTGLKILGLAVVNFAIWMMVSGIVSSVLAVQPHPELQEKGSVIMAIMFVVCLFNTAVLSYAILRSRWRGWKLAATVFWIYFGVNVFLSQIETLYFN